MYVSYKLDISILMALLLLLFIVVVIIVVIIITIIIIIIIIIITTIFFLLISFFFLFFWGWGGREGTIFCSYASWCVSEASETLSGVYKLELVRYIYVWRYVCHNSSACYVYVMWAELGRSHFLYMPAVSNAVINGNGMGTKHVLKGTVRLGLSLVSSLLSTALLP